MFCINLEREFLYVRFNSDAKRKYSRGTLIKKVSSIDRNIRLESLDADAVDRVNSRVLVTVRQNEVERSNGLGIAAKLYTH